jgi:hypothetical protein
MLQLSTSTASGLAFVHKHMCIHIVIVLDYSMRILSKMSLCCNINSSQVQLSSTTGSPSTLNSTSMVIVVLWQLHYSHDAQQSPTLRLQCTGVHNQLQDRTLQQYILLHANNELMTALFASPGLTTLAVQNQHLGYHTIDTQFITNIM